MGMQFNWTTIAGVIGAGGGSSCLYLEEEKDDRYRATYNWNYRLRTSEFFLNQPNYYAGLWPLSSFVSGNPSSLLCPVGQDLAEGICGDRSWETWGASVGGVSRPFFIMGKVTDPVGTPLASVDLDLYLNSTGQWICSGSTDQNGNYQLPTPYPGQNHYIYANYASNTYSGGSSNTLTPNF